MSDTARQPIDQAKVKAVECTLRARLQADMRKLIATICNESDRGATLVAIATIDALIQEVLLAYFKAYPDRLDKLFERLDSLASFKGRLDTVKVLDFASQHFAELLAQFNSIRNNAAHSMEFTAEQHKAKLGSIDKGLEAFWSYAEVRETIKAGAFGEEGAKLRAAAVYFQVYLLAVRSMVGVFDLPLASVLDVISEHWND